MNTIAIQDTSILIDCAKLGLLAALVQLPYRYKTTDLIFNELWDSESREAVQACIDRGELTLERIDDVALEEVATLQSQHRSLSLEDCSVWYLAEQEGAMLLTGDSQLRKKATRGGLEVHGSLWVLVELQGIGHLSQAEACQKLRRLKALNPRLPRTEVVRLEERWCAEDERTKG
jgi:predicted nucleic acid-binding protein